MELYNIIFLVVAALLLCGIVICYFLRKDYFKYSQLAIPVLNTLLNVLRAVGGLTKSNPAINSAITVTTAAIEAAGLAEQLWLAGEIDKTKRPEYAQNYIKDTLEKAGIVISDNLNIIIKGAIALTCYIMPHYEEKENE